MANTDKNDLQDKSKEILEYAKNEGFSIFYSKEFDDYDYDIFDWDVSKDWKEFFTIAKNEEVKIIVASINTFDSSNEDLIKAAQSATEEENEQDEDLDFTKYNGKVGSYRFLWVKDSIKYSLSEMTDWYKEYKEIESTLKGEYAQQQRMAFRTDFLQRREEIPAILTSKSEEELAKEVVEFIEKESPHASRYEVYTLIRLFWSNKGLFDHGLSSQADVIRRRIDLKAEKIFEQKQAKEEKERMPKLVEQCVSWARKNGLKKLILGEVGAFLTEHEITLSREGQRVLWQKVNLELKSG